MKRKKRSIGLFISYINTFLSMFCGLSLSSFLLQKLGNTEYGIYQTMSSFANYLVLLEFGTGTIMSRNLSKCRANENNKLEIEKNISTIWTMTILLSIIISIISVVFYFMIDKIYQNTMTNTEILEGKRMFVFITIFLVVSFYSQTLNGIALAFEDYTFSSRNNILKLISRTLIIVGIIININKAVVIVIVDALIGLVIVLYSYFYCVRKFKIKINCKHFDKYIIKSSLPLCIAIFLQAIINQANSNMGKFILGLKVGPEEVAFYSVGLYIYSIFSSLATIPISLYVPQVIKDVMSGIEEKSLTDTLVQPSRLIVMASGTILFGFFAAGKQFITIVYGHEYMLAWLIALIIMAPMFISMSNEIIIIILDAKNKRLTRSVVLLCTTGLNIFMSIFLIDRIGILGAAISTALSTIIGQIIIMNIYYAKVIKIKVFYMFYKTYTGILIYQIIGTLFGYYMGTVISNEYVAFLVCGITYVFIAFGGFLLFGKNEAESIAIRTFIARFNKKKFKKTIAYKSNLN